MKIKTFFRELYFAARGILLRGIGVFVKKKHPENIAPASILAVRIDRIGDLVVSLPALRLLRQVFPEARISVLVRESNASLLTFFPWMDDVITYRGFLKTVTLLRQRRFDLAIDLLMDYPLKPALLTVFSGSKFTAGFDVAGKGGCFDLALIPSGQKKHVSLYMTDLARAIADAAGRQAGKDLNVEFYVPDEDREFARSLFKDNGIGAGDMVIGIHSGGHYASQRWPVERFARLADMAIKRYGAKIYIIGSLEEKTLIDSMAAMMKGSAVKVIGLPLNRLAALVAITDLFICNNSGPWHIACAFNIPTVSTMGPTDYRIWWPMRGENIVLRKELPCSPCGLAVCLRHDCMKMICLEEMMAAIQTQVEKIKNGKNR
jgi:heptosyltransferase-2